LLSITTTTAVFVWNDCKDSRFNGCNVINGKPQDVIIENKDDECVVVFGIAGDDTITGSALGDCISGGPGKDVIYGEDGDDYIMGGVDADSLFGGAGNDVIWSHHNPFGTVDYMNGGPGNDVLIPGLGVNNMTGGRPGKSGK
jgi:Ca2+-binding RTX toxin-like protein